MSDFSFITPRLATGAAISSEADVEALLSAGVTAIIDCRDDFDDAALFASHPSFRHSTTYLWNGTPDDGLAKPPEWFARSIRFAFHALSHRHERLYAHCAAGVNRGPSTAYAILRAMGIGSETVETMIRMVRPQVGLAYKGDAERAIVEWYS